MLPLQKFSRFWSAVGALPARQRYEKKELLSDRFLLFREGDLSVFYAPFHYLNPEARVVLVGLTPGWTQMERAFRAAKEGMNSGLDDRALFRWIDSTGSFSGPMRSNLVNMLDGTALNRCLRISSCGEFFSTKQHIVHLTSAISAPVFKSGANYTGTPSPLRTRCLRRFIEENLASELCQLPRAVLIPLGKVANAVVEFLATSKLIAFERCLTGFPHPSGANGHRKTLYDFGRERWTAHVTQWFGEA